MSGTSLDGVDGVLVEIPDEYAGGALSPRVAVHLPFATALRAEFMALQASGENEIEREARAAIALTQIYAACIRQILVQGKITRGQVRAIGVHGQTIRHRPDLGFTRQTNNPALLAELTEVDVIADFRSRDIAAGGQGAPLVPAFHQAVFGKAEECRVVLNIGGIANISVLHGDGRVIGFDTGPGNVLMDAWIGRHRTLPYDKGGNWAATGQVCQTLLKAMRDESFLKKTPPKSTGRDLFHLEWLDAKIQLHANARPEDVQATLAQFTADTIAEAISDHAPEAKAVFVSGGGAYNANLMWKFRQALSERKHAAVVAMTDEIGIASNHVEALAFAWLAHRFCVRRAGNNPAVTGAQGGRILGALYPA